MATAVDNDQYTKEVKELTTLLAKGPKPLAELPPALRDPEFLAFAIMDNRLLVGRPHHSWEREPGHSESVADRKMKLTVDAKRIDWTGLDQPYHKSAYELLEEEQTIDERLRLWVKLAPRRKNS